MPSQLVSIYGYHLKDGEKYLRTTTVPKELSEKLYLLGSGREQLSDLVSRFPELIGVTNEDTIFVLEGHGTIKNGVLEIDDVSVAKAIKTLQRILGHKITVIVSTCYAGALLKDGGILDDKNIVVLTRGGKKYINLLEHGLNLLEHIKLFLDKGLGGEKLNTDQILAALVAIDPETFWYYKDGVAIKLPRALKFTLGDIDNLLGSSKSVSDSTKKAIMAKLEETNIGKDTLSIKRIQKSLGWIDDVREKRSEDDRKGDKKKSDQNLSQIFYDQLAKDFTPSQVEKYLRSRSKKITDLGELVNFLPPVDMSILLSMGHYRDSKEIRDVDIKSIKDKVDKKKIAYAPLEASIEKYYSKIYQAIKDGKVKVLQKILSDLKNEFVRSGLNHNIDLEHLYDGGKTALILAAESPKNARKMCKILIKYGAETGRAYIYAAENDNIEMVEIIEFESGISRKSHLNVTDSMGLTPIMIAALKGNIKMVKALKGVGADINYRNYKDESAIQLMIKNQQFDMALELIKLDANVLDLYEVGDLILDYPEDNAAIVKLSALMAKATEVKNILSKYTKEDLKTGSKKSLSMDDLNDILELVTEVGLPYNVCFNNIGVENPCPLLFRLLSIAEDEKVIQKILESVDLLILSDPNIADKRSSKTSLTVVLEKILEPGGERFYDLARKLMLMMNCGSESREVGFKWFWKEITFSSDKLKVDNTAVSSLRNDLEKAYNKMVVTDEDIDKSDSSGATAFTSAVRNKEFFTANVLAKRGANIFRVADNPELAKILIDNTQSNPYAKELYEIIADKVVKEEAKKPKLSPSKPKFSKAKPKKSSDKDSSREDDDGGTWL